MVLQVQTQWSASAQLPSMEGITPTEMSTGEGDHSAKGKQEGPGLLFLKQLVLKEQIHSCMTQSILLDEF